MATKRTIKKYVKRGPPFKPEQKRRGLILKIRLSPEEREQLDKAAPQNLSTWARAVLLAQARLEVADCRH